MHCCLSVSLGCLCAIAVVGVSTAVHFYDMVLLLLPFPCTSGLTTALCTGNCQAGYACPPGSTSATELACPAGQYSVGAAATCQPCPLGRYGDAEATTSAACSGQCAAGTYSESDGQVSALCSGNCTAGYACPTGSTNATAVVCPVGLFSLSGASVCVPCPAGTFGNRSAETTATCAGMCTTAVVVLVVVALYVTVDA